MADEGRLVGGQDYRVGNLEDTSLRKAHGRREGKIGGASSFQRTKGSITLIGERCRNLFSNPVERRDT
jgi:hypothetical protein